MTPFLLGVFVTLYAMGVAAHAFYIMPGCQEVTDRIIGVFCIVFWPALYFVSTIARYWNKKKVRR